MKKYFKWISLAVVCTAMLLCLLNTGCKKQAIQYSTTSDVNIVDYMRRYPDQFSELVKILDRTNISPYLNAYGTYTVFAPTNDAIKLYLKQIGKTSTDQLDTATLSKIITLHVIQDTLSTRVFTDGKLPTITMYGQYLIMGTANVNGVTSTVVNRQANITQPNILTGNGYIHAIDHVLQPAQLTVAAAIAANLKYTIFTQALKATGFYDSLNINNNPDTTRRWLTLLAESDSVLKIAGFNSYSDLARRYNNTGNAKNTSDSLYLFVAYHILTGINYMADIISSPSHPTLAPLQVITDELNGQTILINQSVFNGITEPGIPVDRPNSDNSSTNGVWHAMAGDMNLKVRLPYRVDMDLADQPELRKMTTIFRIAGKKVVLALGQLANVTWQQGTIEYDVAASTSADLYYWNDYFTVTLRIANATTNAWIEFTTPLIVAGQYKVWVNFRRGSGQYIQASVDGQPLAKLLDFTQYLPIAVADSANAPLPASTGPTLESQGYKRYMNTLANKNTQFGELAGVVNITTTDHHKLRLTCIKDATGNATIDMIQFIPVSQDQERPVFGKDGSIIP